MSLVQKLFFLTPLLPLVFCKGSPPSKPSSLGYPISNHTVSLTPPLEKYEARGVFGVEVNIGSQVFKLALDTGSSDTWVLATDANCTNVYTLQPVTPAECGYSGARFEFDVPSFEVIPDVHLNGSYGNGVLVNGLLGYSEVGLGGLTVPQVISAVTYASAAGIPEGNVSGILGLAYPGLTSAFAGTDPSKDIRCEGNSSCGPILYSPIIHTLFADRFIDPVFSIALSRSNSFGGVMTIGGIPRLDETYVNASETIMATSPIIPPGNGTVPIAYTAEVESLVYSNATSHSGRGRYLLDTGTIANSVPKKQADAINALFVPPAVFNATKGYVVACDAIAPELGISIGGQVFYHNPKDMILQYDGYCFSAVQPASEDSSWILGASWLKNVLAVFDVGASEITFVGRTYYEDS